MSYIVDEHGFAERLHDADACRWAMLRGERIYNSLADAVHLGGVIATPFRNAISTKPRYDCFRALGLGGQTPQNHPVEPEMVAVGLRAVYEIHGPARAKARRSHPAARARHDAETTPVKAITVGATTVDF